MRESLVTSFVMRIRRFSRCFPTVLGQDLPLCSHPPRLRKGHTPGRGAGDLIVACEAHPDLPKAGTLFNSCQSFHDPTGRHSDDGANAGYKLQVS